MRAKTIGFYLMGVFLCVASVHELDRSPNTEPLVSSTRPFAYEQTIPNNPHRYDIAKAGPQAANFPELAEPPSVTESNPCEGADVCAVPGEGATIHAFPGRGKRKDYRDLGKVSDLESAIEDEINQRAEEIAGEMVESGERG